MYGTGLRFLTEKFILSVSLRTPETQYFMPNALLMWEATMRAVHMSEPKPLFLGLARSMPSRCIRSRSDRRHGLPDSCNHACTRFLRLPAASASHIPCFLHTRWHRIWHPGTVPSSGVWMPVASSWSCGHDSLPCMALRSSRDTSGRNSAPRFIFFLLDVDVVDNS